MIRLSCPFFLIFFLKQFIIRIATSSMKFIVESCLRTRLQGLPKGFNFRKSRYEKVKRLGPYQIQFLPG